MKTEVFKRAWILHRNNYGEFSKCLTQAWKIVKLKNKMKSNVVSFEFSKKDGTVRSAVGTLSIQISKGTGKAASLSVFPYYDVEKEQVRSFKIENLI